MQESELKAWLQTLQPINRDCLSVVKARLDSQTKPKGSLGRLEALAQQFVAITNRQVIRRKRIYVFAADHGVAEEGVSAFPQTVTGEMVRNFTEGGAAINALAKQAGAEVQVVDMGVNANLIQLQALHHCKIAMGTKNFMHQPAMTRQQAQAALATGVAFAKQAKSQAVDLLGTGEMGIGNSTSASAMTAVMTKLPVEQVTHHGTGIDEPTLAKKIAVIKHSLALHQPNACDPLDVLAKVGGFEIAGIAGLVLGGALCGIPVVVDGFISTVGAMIACELSPLIAEYLVAAHESVEIGHIHVLNRMNLAPLLRLGLRLGEGTGAALAMTLVEAALCGLRDIRTFHEAGVTQGSFQ